MEDKALESKLETLLRSKTFAQLSAVEQSYVAQFLSEEEYADMAFVLKNAKAGLLSNYDSLQPRPQTFDILTQALTEKPSVVKHLRYPALLAAVLLALTGSIFIFLHFKQDNPSLSQPVARLPKTQNKIIENQKPLIAETKATLQPPVKNIPAKSHRQVLAKIKHLPVGHSPNVYLCSDIHIIGIRSSLSDTVSNIPCLNTRIIMPQTDDDSATGYKTTNNNK